MSIPKLVGLETEFGIGGDERIRASRRVVLAYPWISLDPSGDVSAPSGRRNPSVAHGGEDDMMLANGARLYVDHAHPEYSTPESADPLVVVALEQAGAIIAQRCAELASLRGPTTLRLYKNNSDHQGHSYACHENYLIEAGTFDALFNRPSGWIDAYVAPFLVSRMLFTGAGKVGAENGNDPAHYQISQRADFLECVRALQTTYARPIVNTRDEAHADRSRFGRLHVIAGDANMCPFATWLKVGTMQLFLRMLEDGALGSGLELADPVRAVRQVSRDLRCRDEVQLANGKRWTFLQLQRAFLESAQTYLAARTPTPSEAAILVAWEETLLALETDASQLFGKIDWVTKYELLDQLREEASLDWADPRMHESDIKYHALAPDESLFALLQRSGLIVSPPGWDPSAVDQYLRQPPTDSRASLRGKCIERFQERIKHADWSEIIFETMHLRFDDPAALTDLDVDATLAHLADLIELPRAENRPQTVSVATVEEPAAPAKSGSVLARKAAKPRGQRSRKGKRHGTTPTAAGEHAANP